MIKNIAIFCVLFGNFYLNACNFTKSTELKNKVKDTLIVNYDTTTFAAGCFWCVEAIFAELKGVIKVTSGYTGGIIQNPTYEQVCSGKTGHAEAVQIIFDTTLISFIDLLEIFWQTHDPTTLNKQGADEGTQYRSAVFYHNELQKKSAIEFKNKLNENKIFYNPIVTEILEASKFFNAEDYHQNYYSQNNSKPYCSYVIKPKIDKFRKQFKNKLK